MPSKKLGADISDEVVAFMATNISANVREIEGALSLLLANVSFLGRKITISLAKEILKVYVQLYQKEITIDHIIEVVCEYLHLDFARFNSTEAHAKSPKRAKSPCTWPNSTRKHRLRPSVRLSADVIMQRYSIRARRFPTCSKRIRHSAGRSRKSRNSCLPDKRITATYRTTPRKKRTKRNIPFSYICTTDFSDDETSALFAFRSRHRL